MEEKKLLKYAVDYLSKYDSSKKNLVSVLKRKIFKLNTINYEKGKLYKTINNIIKRLEENNLLNDDRYCSAKINSLLNVGKSKKFIFNYLIKKGIDANLIQLNFEELFTNKHDWEIESAKLFAKKKKLLESSENYEKKLAKMARAGFSYDICKKILG